METPEDTTPDLVHQAELAQKSQCTSPYSPIDSERGDIRLLELAPGEFDDPILITLVESNLSASEERPYEALSYVWGTAISSEKVLLNGVPVEVTSNLDCALRHLRFKLATRILWIDALSMNQKDVQERNHQVKIMGRIYSTADKVIIWLGPVDSGDVYLKAMLDVMQSASASALYLEYSWFAKQGFITDLIQKLHVNTHELCAYDAVYRIVTRPWFNRLWVVQELALSKTADVHIGEYTTSWGMFDEFVAIVSTQTDVQESGHELWPAFLLVRKFALGRPFRKQLVDTLHLSATDPRDKIFGILGISQLGSCNIQPDYTKSVQRVFSEAMSMLLEDTESTPYRYVPLQPLSDNLSLTSLRGLPSWVPDFRIMNVIHEEVGGGYVLGTLNDASLPFSLLREASNLTCSNLEPAFKATLSADLTRLHAIRKPMGAIVRTSGDVLYDIGEMHDRVLILKLRRLFGEIARPLGASAEVFLGALFGSFEYAMRLATREIKDSVTLIQLLDPTTASVNSSWQTPREFSGLLADIASYARNRICFVTDAGDVGLSYHPDPKNGIRPGDVVARLFHDSTFFILRPMDGSTYQMINVATLMQHSLDERVMFVEDDENGACDGPFSRHTKMSTEKFNALSPEAARQALDAYGLKQYTIV
jgi:hypothetical protein